MPEWPSTVRVVIEVPRFGLVKREMAGDGFRVDYVSPLPSPFNYGCVPDLPGADGDPLDAVVLGARLPVGAAVVVPVRGVVRFVDGGAVDDKLVCGHAPPTGFERRSLTTFFRMYAVARRGLNVMKGVSGETAFRAVELSDPAPGSTAAETRVYAASNVANAHLVVETLLGAGLHPRMRGDLRPGMAGAVPVADARVEVVVPTNEAPEATALLHDLDVAAAGPGWTCASCGEANPPTFASCWSCQAVRGARGA